MAGKKDGAVTVTKRGVKVRYLSLEELERRLEQKEYPEAAQYFERIANRQPAKEP